MLMTILIIDTCHYTTTIINKNINDNADNDSDTLDTNANTDNADNTYTFTTHTLAEWSV